MDTRHQKRIKLIQNLFAYEFVGSLDSLPHPKEGEINEIVKRKDQLDAVIKKYAPRFPLEKIAKVDLAILRWAVYELIVKKELPYKVVIDEAVELAKELAGNRSYAFVNGVLGSLVEELLIADKKEQ